MMMKGSLTHCPMMMRMRSDENLVRPSLLFIKLTQLRVFRQKRPAGLLKLRLSMPKWLKTNFYGKFLITVTVLLGFRLDFRGIAISNHQCQRPCTTADRDVTIGRWMMTSEFTHNSTYNMYRALQELTRSALFATYFNWVFFDMGTDMHKVLRKSSHFLEDSCCLWCQSLKHRCLCAKIPQPSNDDHFLIPLIETLLLVM